MTAFALITNNHYLFNVSIEFASGGELDEINVENVSAALLLDYKKFQQHVLSYFGRLFSIDLVESSWWEKHLAEANWGATQDMAAMAEKSASELREGLEDMRRRRGQG